MSNNYMDQSNLVQQNYTIEQIATLWNNSHLGKPAKNSTVERWLNNGPTTKNPNFEPFICGIAGTVLLSTTCNWPEYYSYENGDEDGTCPSCGLTYFGFAPRNTCFNCTNIVDVVTKRVINDTLDRS